MARRGFEADPFASVFQALRTSLTAQVVHAQHNASSGKGRAAATAAAPIPLNAWPRSSDSDIRLPHTLAAADAFLGSMAQSDMNVRAVLHHQVQSGAIQELRRKRKQTQKKRQVHIRELQQQQQAIACDCDHVIRQAQVNAIKYAQFASQSHERSSQRLQTLLFECIAEMQKALERIDGIAIESADESESMAHERATQFAWDVFLARLQHDLNGAACFSQLYPLYISTGGGASASEALALNASNKSNIRSHVAGSSDANSTALKAAMRDLLIRNGPVLESGQTLEIQRIIAVLPSKSSTSPHSAASTLSDASNSSKAKPSLHFGDSGASAWLNIARSTIQAATPLSVPSSRRSHRQLPPSKRAVSATFSTSSTTTGETSEIRQFATKTTLQFPRTECDVPLSSTYISWLFASGSIHCFGKTSWAQTIDSNVYFDLEEYELKLTKAMGLGSALASANGTHFVTDKAVFASAQRSLHEVNLILEHARKLSSSSPRQVHQILLARRAQNCTDSSKLKGHQQQQHSRESIFVRASVLQLLQIAYYSDQFLRKLSPSDVVVLEQLYPTSLFGAGILEKLYVPYFDVDVDANPSTKPEVVVPISSTGAIVMKPLDQKAIHELLLVYVARGRQECTEASSSGGARLASLAMSDSISTLYPATHEHNSSEDATQDEPAAPTKPPSVHQCTIKSPRSLWKQGRAVKRTGAAPHESAAAQVINSAEYLYVEYQISQASHTEELSQRKSSRAADLPTQIQEIFSRGCYWRSCLAPAQVPPQSHNTAKQNLCAWHGVLKQFLSADEVEQYLLSPSELKICLATLDIGSRAESVKRVIQKSSSLLDELTSRQLATSIGSFFEHVKLSFSNQAFENQSLDGHERNRNATMALTVKDTHDQQAVDDLEALAEELEQILTLERSCSREFQRLIQLTVYPGVDTSVIRKACLEVKEYDAGIRTNDLALMLRLSTRKLQLVRRRREDEEARVTLRIAQSNSTSTISAYSAASSYGSDTTTTQVVSSSSPVYDVVHVLRKGRKSLLMQQQQQQRLNQNQGFRPQSAGSSSFSATGVIDKGSLSRSVSEILHQAPQQFELKHPVKRRSGVHIAGKKPPAKPYRR